MNRNEESSPDPPQAGRPITISLLEAQDLSQWVSLGDNESSLNLKTARTKGSCILLLSIVMICASRELMAKIRIVVGECLCCSLGDSNLDRVLCLRHGVTAASVPGPGKGLSKR